MRMQGYCNVYKWTILKLTSPEVKCLELMSSRREMCTSSVSNVIYHKFSHGAAFYKLNGKNVNVMLEFCVFLFSTVSWAQNMSPTVSWKQQINGLAYPSHVGDIFLPDLKQVPIYLWLDTESFQSSDSQDQAQRL